MGAGTCSDWSPLPEPVIGIWASARQSPRSRRILPDPSPSFSNRRMSPDGAGDVLMDPSLPICGVDSRVGTGLLASLQNLLGTL